VPLWRFCVNSILVWAAATQWLPSLDSDNTSLILVYFFLDTKTISNIIIGYSLFIHKREYNTWTTSS